MTTNFKPYPCAIDCERLSPILPGTMVLHVETGGMLYVVAPIRNGLAFVSTSPNANGALCTYVDASLVAPVKPFVEAGAEVWCVVPENDETPVLKAVVEDLRADCVELDVEYVGFKCVPYGNVFANRAEAEASLR